MFNHTTSPSLTQRLLQYLGGLSFYAIFYLCRFYIHKLNDNDLDSWNITLNSIGTHISITNTMINMINFSTMSIRPEPQPDQVLLLFYILHLECLVWISVSKFIALISFDGLITNGTTAAAYILCLLWHMVLLPIAGFFAFYIASYDYWDARYLNFWGALKFTGTLFWERLLLYIRRTFSWISSQFNWSRSTGNDNTQFFELDVVQDTHCYTVRVCVLRKSVFVCELRERSRPLGGSGERHGQLR